MISDRVVTSASFSLEKKSNIGEIAALNIELVTAVMINCEALPVSSLFWLRSCFLHCTSLSTVSYIVNVVLGGRGEQPINNQLITASFSFRRNYKFLKVEKKIQ